jgi:hypothetical protein
VTTAAPEKAKLHEGVNQPSVDYSENQGSVWFPGIEKELENNLIMKWEALFRYWFQFCPKKYWFQFMGSKKLLKRSCRGEVREQSHKNCHTPRDFTCYSASVKCDHVG